jgi:CHAT domain-containing protein/predicted negative regulator of RcsB-dependent stress response
MFLGVSNNTNNRPTYLRTTLGLPGWHDPFCLIKIGHIGAVFLLVFAFCVTPGSAQESTFEDVIHKELDSWLEEVEQGKGSEKARDLFMTFVAQAESLSVEDVLSGFTKAAEQAEEDSDHHGEGIIRAVIYSTALSEDELRVSDLEKAVQLLDGVADQLYVALLKKDIGVLYSKMGELDDALQCFTAITDIYRRYQIEDDLADVLAFISEIYLYKQKYDSALTSIAEAESIYKRKASNEQYIYLLKIKGQCYMYQFNFQDALQTFHSAEEIARHIGNDEELASVLALKYNAYFNLDQIEDGLHCLDEAEHIYRTKKMDAALAEVLKARCLGYQELERYQDVIDNTKEIIHLYESLEQLEMVAYVLLYEASAYQGLEQFEEALSSYEKIERIYGELGLDMKLVATLSDKIDIYMILGRYEDALIDYEKAEKLFIKHGLDLNRAELAVEKANVHRHIGQLKETLASFKVAKEIFEKEEAHERLISVLIDMGLTNHQMDRNKEALQYFSDAEELVQKDEQPEYLGAIALSRGLVYTALERYEDAMNSYDKAEEIFQSLDGEVELALINMYRSRVLSEVGHYQEALNKLDEAESVFTKYEMIIETMAIFFERGHIQVNMKLAKKQDLNIKDFLSQELALWVMKVFSGLGSKEVLQIVYDCWENQATITDDQLIEYEQTAAIMAERDNDSLGAGLLYATLGVAQEIPIGIMTQQYLGKAIQLLNGQVDATLIALLKLQLGLVLYELGHYENALENLVEAEETFNKYGMELQIGQVAVNKGNVYQHMSRFTDAFDQYDKAEKIFIEIDREDKLTTLYVNRGAINGKLGRYREALLYFDKAEEFLTEEREEGKYAKLLEDKGNASFYLGRLEEALKYYQEAEKTFVAQNMKPQLANVIANEGAVYKMLGRYEEALSKYDEAENIYIEAGMEAHCNALLDNKAVTYLELNLFDEALRIFNEGEEFFKAREMTAEIANINLNRGTLFLRVGRFEEALLNYIKAEEIFKEKGLKQNLGVIYENMGIIFLLMKNYGQALEYSIEAEKIFGERGMMVNLAEIYQNKGNILSHLDQHEAALDEFDKAEKIYGQRRMEAALSLVYQGRGMTYEFQDNLKRAIASYKKAIDISEKVRGEIKTEKMKTSLMTGKVNAYKHLISLLVDIGEYKEAFHYAERSTARSFLDLLSEREVKNTHQGISKELLNQRNELLGRISWYQEQIAQESFDLLEKELVKVEEELEKLERKIKMESPAYAALVYPEPLTLKEVQENIPDQETALLEYCVTDEKIILWVVKQKTSTVYTIGISAEELSGIIHEYRVLLMSQFAIDTLKQYEYASMLYDSLIRPADSVLEGISRLIIVPDGPLHYLPFQALRAADGRYLLGHYPISYAPSATVLGEIDEWKEESVPEADLVAFAVQDFGERAVSTGRGGAGSLMSAMYEARGLSLRRLQYTHVEVDSIKAIYRTAVVHKDTQAVEIRAKDESYNYRFVHFATHGLLDEQKPMYSGVVLTRQVEQADDGFLQAYEIYNIRLNADLVVLSACRTGLGTLTKGEGLVGLARAFMYAGSPSLVVSLWKVEDISTAYLMRHFYLNLKQGLAKDEALRQAQLKVMDSEYSAPVYWAPFVLIGDWK